MCRLGSVGFAWLIALLLVVTPLTTMAPIGVSAQTEDGTPISSPEPSIDPTQDASATPAAGDPSPTEVPTESATETDGSPVDPTAPLTEDASPIASPAETETLEPTSTPEPTSTVEPTRDDADFAAAELSDIVITINCRSAPETVRVTNNGVASIQLTSIGSFVDLIAGEPFPLSRNLKPGNTAIFQSGDGAQYGTVLTQSYLYTNTAYDAEGVQVTTSIGTASMMCPPKPPPPLGKLSDLSVSLSCRTSAETIRVTNNGAGWITIKGLATYIDAIPAEPFAVSRVLKPGQTRIFQAGADAQYGTVLTTRYIFTNSAYEKDGIRISTDVGKIYKACPPKPVPPERWIEVNLSAQYLTAWVGNTRVNGTLVSTGKPGFETPTGTYYVLYRYRYDTMAGCIQGECYYVPDVPWTQYFTNYGHALHGAYWHNDFGTTRSHGCVNLPLWFAEWLWNWATYGTRLWIHY